MKPRALLRLIVSLLLIAAFVIGATILEASNSLDPAAWYWAQRQLPVLWAVDAFAVLALVPVCGFASSQNRLIRKSEEIGRVRDEHQTQIDIMIRNAEHADDMHAEQAERIQSLQQATDELTRKLDALESDAAARQQAIEAEARHLAEQAFASLSGQVEANTRHMEAVSLAMQYQRAEIKQLRQGVRAIQRHPDVIDVSRLTPQEQAALEAGEGDGVLRLTGEAGEPNVFQEEPDLLVGLGKRQHREGEDDLLDAPLPLLPPEHSASEFTPLDPSTGFAPTMNAQSTIISPLTAYAVAPLPEHQISEDQGGEDAGAEPESRKVSGSEQAVGENTEETTESASSSQGDSGPLPPGLAAAGVTAEEYQLLTRPVVYPASPESAAKPASAPGPQTTLRRSTLRKLHQDL